jgi:hypothetical protein
MEELREVKTSLSIIERRTRYDSTAIVKLDAPPSKTAMQAHAREVGGERGGGKGGGGGGQESARQDVKELHKAEMV